MAFFESFLSFVPFGVTPFVVGILLVPVLCQGAVVSLPYPFLLTQLAISFFTRPILGLATSGLLLPVFLLLASTPAFCLSFAGLFCFFCLRTISQNIGIAGQNLIDAFAEHNPVNIKKNVQVSVKHIFTTLGEFLENTNFTEVFQNVTSPHLFSQHQDIYLENGDLMLATGTHLFRSYSFPDIIRNLTISETTQQHIDAVNVAVVGLLEKVEVSDFFNTTRISPNLYICLDKVSEATRIVAESLNFTDILRAATVSSEVKESFVNLGDALKSFEHLNLTELCEPVVSSLTTEEAISKLHPWPPLFSHVELQSLGMPSQTASWGEFIRAFISWVPMRFRIVTNVYLVLFLVGAPCLFMLRAALYEGFMWLVVKRYDSDVPSPQRSASGWMFVAAISGLASAAVEAFPYCCLCYYVYTSNMLVADEVIIFVIHVLAAVPFRAASQMRIAEVGARRKVLKENKLGFISAFFLVAVIEGVFNMWWLCFSGTLIISRIILWLPGLFVLTDALLIGLSVFWGRTICRRVLRDERQMIEDRERKRD